MARVKMESPHLRMTFAPRAEPREDGGYTPVVDIQLYEHHERVQGGYSTLYLPAEYGQFETEEAATAHAQALCNLYNIRDIA